MQSVSSPALLSVWRVWSGVVVVWCGVASVTNLSVRSELGRDDGGTPGHPHSLPEGGGQAGGQAGEEPAGEAQSEQQQEHQQHQEQHHQGAITAVYLSELLSDLLVSRPAEFQIKCCK